jgi:hypothetical protein
MDIAPPLTREKTDKRWVFEKIYCRFPVKSTALIANEIFIRTRHDGKRRFMAPGGRSMAEYDISWGGLIAGIR